jgi:hypothetical protein
LDLGFGQQRIDGYFTASASGSTSELKLPKNFRFYLDETLKAIADDQSQDPSAFKNEIKKSLDPEADFAVLHLFQVSHLDPEILSHWQILLVAVANAIVKLDAGRSTFWTDERERVLFRQAAAIKKGDPRIKALELCRELKTKHSWNVSAETLRTRLQRVLRRLRAEVRAGKAPSALKKQVRLFE